MMTDDIFEPLFNHRGDLPLTSIVHIGIRVIVCQYVGDTMR